MTSTSVAQQERFVHRRFDASQLDSTGLDSLRPEYRGRRTKTANGGRRKQNGERRMKNGERKTKNGAGRIKKPNTAYGSTSMFPSSRLWEEDHARRQEKISARRENYSSGGHSLGLGRAGGIFEDRVIGININIDIDVDFDRRYREPTLAQIRVSAGAWVYVTANRSHPSRPYLRRDGTSIGTR